MQNAVRVFDGAPVSGSFCGATDSGAWDCGPAIDGADLWYTYFTPIDCVPSDITITVTTGDAEIQAYFPGGNLNSPSSCRGASVNGVYTDTLNPGESILFRVQSPTGSDFVLEASSDFITGLPDCDGNGVPDACDLAADPSLDCNGNGRLDSCDIADGTSKDCDGDGIPDECGGFTDCNGNGVPDACDIASGVSQDCDSDGIPDECDPSADCPPANDDRANAQVVTPGTYFYNLRFGTLDGSASCSAGSSVIDSDIWYTYTADVDGRLVVSQFVNSIFDFALRVAIFDDQGNELACNNAGTSSISDTRALTSLSAGQTALIRIVGSTDLNVALDDGQVEIRFAPGLTNDRCDGALDVELDTPYPFDPRDLEVGGVVETSCVSDFDRLDVWYRYTSQSGGRTRFRTDEIWTGVTVFDACGGNELGCDRGTGSASPPPAVEIDMAEGQSVIVRVVELINLNPGNFFVEEVGPCNAADLAEPFGVLDLSDINAFTSGFIVQDPAADLDANGIFDLTDINIFTSTFVAGCP